MARGLSCSMACGIFLDQGSNPCLLHWQADSLPLSQGEIPLRNAFNHKQQLQNNPTNSSLKKDKCFLALIHQSKMPSKARLNLSAQSSTALALGPKACLAHGGKNRGRETCYQFPGKRSCLRNPRETYACNSLARNGTCSHF